MAQWIPWRVVGVALACVTGIVCIVRQGYKELLDTSSLQRTASSLVVGWHGEAMPSGVLQHDVPFVYRLDRNDIHIEVVYVPPGEFIMGRNVERPGHSDEHPRHVNTVEEGYYLGRYEVTVGQFRTFVQATGYRTWSERGDMTPVWSVAAREWVYPRPGPNWRDPGFEQTDQHPVVCVSWDDAMAFCLWLDVDLPSEREWEKGARGRDGREHPWGDDWRVPHGNYERADRVATAKTTVVGAYPHGVSPWGAFDMAGNVWEWCSDYYDPYLNHRSARGDFSPSHASGARPVRGGSWHSSRVQVRTYYRERELSDEFARPDVGFRIVKRSSVTREGAR